MLFNDFAAEGGKCCYLKINSLNENKKGILCVPSTKFSRTNNFFLNIFIEHNKFQTAVFIAILICDDLQKSYNSLTKEWTVIEGKLKSN